MGLLPSCMNPSFLFKKMRVRQRPPSFLFICHPFMFWYGLFGGGGETQFRSIWIWGELESAETRM